MEKPPLQGAHFCSVLAGGGGIVGLWGCWSAEIDLKDEGAMVATRMHHHGLGPFPSWAILVLGST